MDLINKISCSSNSDSKHHIHYLQSGQLQSMTLQKLDQRATILAEKLRSLNFVENDLIGVMAKNSIEWVLLDLASLKLGTILVGFEVGRYDVKTILSEYGLKILFQDEITNDRPNVASMLDIANWCMQEDISSTDSVFQLQRQTHDVIAIKFTSGTTGKPKGLGATVGSINDSLSSVQEMFHHVDGDNILIFLPYSLLQQRYWVYSALLHGHDITITTLTHIFSVASSLSPTVIMGVPGFFDTVKKHVELSADEPLDNDNRRIAIESFLGGSIRYLWTGSAPCSPSTLEFFNSCGVSLFEGYGMNETCIVAKNYPGAHRVGSVGKILAHKKVYFDEHGMLTVAARHPVNTSYLWCSKGDNEKIFLPSGDVKTGDLGYLDEDGYLYISGRADDLIVLSNGHNVDVRAIEEYLRSLSCVHECILYGMGKPFLSIILSLYDKNIDKKLIDSHIGLLNQTSAKNYPLIGVVIASEPFSLENGFLNSQLKPVRKNIYKYFLPQINKIYKKE